MEHSLRYKIVPLRKLSDQMRKYMLNQKIENIVHSDNHNTNSVKAIYSKSYTSNSIVPSSVQSVMRPWNMHTMHSLYTHTTFGKKFIDTYFVSKREYNKFILTPDKIYKNGNVVCNEPSILVLYPGILFRYVIGSMGASTINVHTNPSQLEEYDENLTPFMNEEQNILRTCTVNTNTNKIELLDEYNETEHINTTPEKEKLNKLMNRWEDIQFII